MHPIDESVLLGVSGGCRELAVELLDTFLDELPREWASLADAVRRGEAGPVREAAHRLCGSLGLIGAQRAAELTRRLEMVAAAGRVTDIEAQWGVLHEWLAELGPALTQWRQRLLQQD